MERTEIKNEGIEGVTLCRNDERIFSIHLSMNVHDELKTAQKDILELAYTHALMAGCGTYTRESFLDALNMLGASLSISVSNGVLGIHATSLNHVHAKLLSLLEMMLTKPTFASAEVKRIVELIENELNEEEENAKARSIEELTNTLYDTKDSRYIFTPTQLVKALPAVNVAKLKSIHEQILAKKWIFTVTASPELAKVSAARLLRLRKVFKQSSPAPQIHSPLSIDKKTIRLTSIPSKQNIEINIGAPLELTTTDKDFFAFVFGLNVLGKWGGFAGRLMSTVREKEGLTYGIYARVEKATKTEHGFWRIMTFFAPEKVVEGINATIRELKLIQKKGITAQEFERFKNIIETSYVLINDSVLAQASKQHAFQLDGYTLAEIEAYRKNMQLVTHEEVNNALKKYLAVEQIVISAAGPVASKEKELKSL